MKYTVLFAVCLFSFSFAHAQNLTGIWRGNFITGFGMFKEQYNYELQINQRKDKSLRGVTYSYLTKVLYSKTGLKGINHGAAKSIDIIEDSIIVFKSSTYSTACLFSCYLTYHKEGKTEVLEGTYDSYSVVDGKPCGNGTIHLERVPESDFYKEDFLLKKPGKATQSPLVKKAQPPVKKIPPAAPVKKAPAQPPLVKKTPPTPQVAKPPVKPLVKPIITDTNSIARHKPENNQPVKDSLPVYVPVPPALKQRENSLVRTITTNSPDIKVQLYDNGEIDGDTVTVYHNNTVVAYHKRLAEEPITLNIKASKTDENHEFVMYADNLGKIPPNTALMVITTGGNRYEIPLTSTMQKNAKVMVHYEP